MRGCRVCRDAPDGAPLPHEPRPIFVVSSQAKIVIASQAPGLRAHQSGIPFLDPSGTRLRAWLGVSESEFYRPANFAIVPMGFCFPGYDANQTDLPPRRECAPRWHDFALSLMPQAELMLLIGGHSQRWHLGTTAKSMTQTVRAWKTLLADERRPRTLPLPHPSWRNSGWLNRNPWFEAELLPNLRTMVRILLQQSDD